MPDVYETAEKLRKVAEVFGSGELADLAHTAEQLERSNDLLIRWQAEAMEVIKEWEKLWDLMGRPGELGESKAASTYAAVDEMKFRMDGLDK